MLAATLQTGETAEYRITSGRKVFLVPASGRIRVNDIETITGDGMAIRDEELLQVKALEESKIVLVDVV